GERFPLGFGCTPAVMQVSAKTFDLDGAMDLVSQTLEVEMLFNKKPDHGTEFDCLGDNAARSSNGFVPFNPASQSLNVHAEALRQRSGAPARSVIDAWLTMKGN